jgi:hypothetical protein
MSTRSGSGSVHRWCFFPSCAVARECKVDEEDEVLAGNAPPLLLLPAAKGTAESNDKSSSAAAGAAAVSTDDKPKPVEPEAVDCETAAAAALAGTLNKVGKSEP